MSKRLFPMIVYDIIIIILIKMVGRVIIGMMVKCHSTCFLFTARSKEKKVRSACIMYKRYFKEGNWEEDDRQRKRLIRIVEGLDKEERRTLKTSFSRQLQVWFELKQYCIIN